MQNKKLFICGYEPAKMHCEFTYTTNAFQEESWNLSNFICYEGSCISNWDKLLLEINISGADNQYNSKYICS